MFPEDRLLHEQLSAFKRIAVEEMCVIIVQNIVWMGQTIVMHFGQFPKVKAHCGRHVVQHFEKTVE